MLFRGIRVHFSDSFPLKFFYHTFKAGSLLTFVPDMTGDYVLAESKMNDRSSKTIIGSWHVIAEKKTLSANDTLDAVAGPVVNGILLGDGKV